MEIPIVQLEEKQSKSQKTPVSLERAVIGSIFGLGNLLIEGVSLTHKAVSRIVVVPLVLMELFATLGLSCAQELVLWIVVHMVRLSHAAKQRGLPGAEDSLSA